ncbi:hypothetical protein FOCC_FOCC017214, partial [Frankliniella occidentalis]
MTFWSLPSPVPVHIVVDKITSLEVGTAQSITCSAVLVYNGNSGPSFLKKQHDSYCTAQLAAGSNTPYRPVPVGVFIDKVADTCALTMGAVEMLTSDAVVDMVQTAVDIAARCKGRVDVRALMPSRTTVMAHINTRADEATVELVPRATGANIRAVMVQKLESIGIHVEDFEKIEWVTDRGANVRKALEDLP